MRKEEKSGWKKHWRWMLLLVAVLVLAIGVGITIDRFVNRSPAQEKDSSSPSSTEGPTLYTLDEEPSESTRTEVEPPSAALDVPVGNRVGQRAPDFTLSRLDGGEVSLSEFRGRVVILDFWATWCGPCRASMPGLETLRARYQDKGLVLVSVSLDRREEDARSYLERTGYAEFIGLWESLATTRELALRYGVLGIPRTFVIDRQGIIRYCGHPTRLTAATIDPWL